jgi:two-component system response regulator MprA
MRALLRRVSNGDGESPPEGEVLRLGDLRIETGGRRVTRHGAEIELSKTEYELLELLVRNAGVVLDHSTIYDRIWHFDFGPDSKNLAVYIGYLRRKTEEGGGERLIHTVRGVGYVAREER